MLLFSTLVTVVLVYNQEVVLCENEKEELLSSSSLPVSFLSSLFSNIASTLFPSSDETVVKSKSSVNKAKSDNADHLLVNSSSREPKSISYDKSFNSLLTTYGDNVAKFIEDENFEEKLKEIVEFNKNQLQKTLKKNKWKEKVQNKINNKYKNEKEKSKEIINIEHDNKNEEEKENEEDYEERLNQLNELYDLQNPLEEREDEIHDAEILQAVYNSIFDHKKGWLKRFVHKMVGKIRVKRDEEMVCYKDLGCFRDEGPFDYFDMLPNSPEEVNTKFILHTKQNQKREQFLSYTNASTILNSNFTPKRKTKVIIHGFGSSCHRVWVREMRETFLKMEDVNVICVQWEEGASTPNYVRAASNTRLVGAQVALFLDLVSKVTNMSLDDVHLIGFSLGAHVSGYAGQRLKGIGRISGLDPAGPLFESFPRNMRLDASDAKFVDVIHTNADSLLWGGLGAYDPMGHVDFYPNGGRVQKGCKNLFVGGVSDILWPKEGDGRYLCNHRRGYKYFMESVIPICTFPAFPCKDYETFQKGECFPCKDCGNMGYYADKSTGRGQMFLVTRETEPFCANQFKVEIWHSGGPPTTDSVSTQGRFDVTFVSGGHKNETIEVTRDTGKKMHAGSRTVAIIVLHVAISNINNVQVRYTSYRGWISSGFNRWAIDKLSIMSSSGNIQSFCHRGLTMESGQTMVFPLVPGDCNPRELTLHPLPVPWPGIDYNTVQNGIQYFPPSYTPQHNLPVNPSFNNLTSGTNSITPTFNVHQSGLQKTPTHERNPLKSISPPAVRPKEPTTTFSVIYDAPHQINDTKFEILRNVSNEGEFPIHNTNDTMDDVLTGPMMTEEEFLAWRDAPPPNLDASNFSDNDELTNTERLPNEVISNVNPISSNQSPRLKSQSRLDSSHDKHKYKSTKFEVSLEGSWPHNNITNQVRKLEENADSSVLLSDSIIREDAQIKDHKTINEEKVFDNHDIGESQVEFDYYLLSKPDQHDNVERKETKKMFRETGNDNDGTARNKDGNIYIEETLLRSSGIADPPPFNSVIDGEVPFKERARAMKFFHSPLNLHSIPERKQEISDSSKESLRKNKDGDIISKNFDPNDKTGNKNENEKKLTAIQEEIDTQQVLAHNPFSGKQTSEALDILDQENQTHFSYGFYNFGAPLTFKASNLKGLHTLPPTVLRPPAIKPIVTYKNFEKENSPHLQQNQRVVPPPLKPTQYSNFYAQHRYYPRPPPEYKTAEVIHDESVKQFSESSAIPLFEQNDSIFLHNDPSSSFVSSYSQPFYSSYTPQTTKAPKRSFNPLSFFSSLRQKNEGRFTRPFKALFGSRKESAPNEPNEARAHQDRFPFYVPVFSSSIDFSKAPSSPPFNRIAIPTHLRAPPLSESENRQITRDTDRKTTEVLSQGEEENKFLRRSQASLIHPLQPASKFQQTSPSLTPKSFNSNRQARFIPIRVSRSSRLKTSRQDSPKVPVSKEHFS